MASDVVRLPFSELGRCQLIRAAMIAGEPREGASMERGPLALFGAIVAVGLGPAMWLGAQFGHVSAVPGTPPAVTVQHDENQGRNQGDGGVGAAAPDEPTEVLQTSTRSHVEQLATPRPHRSSVRPPTRPTRFESPTPSESPSPRHDSPSPRPSESSTTGPTTGPTTAPTTGPAGDPTSHPDGGDGSADPRPAPPNGIYDQQGADVPVNDVQARV
jgi:hypothetical protein